MREALYRVPRPPTETVRPSRLTIRLEPTVVIEVPSIRALRGFVQPVFGVRASKLFFVAEVPLVAQFPSVRALRGLVQPTFGGRVSRVVTITEGAPPPFVGEGVYIPTFRPRRR